MVSLNWRNKGFLDRLVKFDGSEFEPSMEGSKSFEDHSWKDDEDIFVNRCIAATQRLILEKFFEL